MKNSKIIVTGGAGFIGSNLSRRLIKDKNKVIIIDDLSSGNYNNIKDLQKTGQVEFIKGTITDLNLLKKTFKEADYVFHQAAIASIPKSIEDPIKSNDVNVNGTLNVLVAARENNVKKVIFASSCAIYGDKPTLPKNEDMMPHPIAPYSANKLTAEYYCNVFTKVYDLKTIALRYFNVYGPRQDPNGDYAAVIPKFISMVLKNKPPVIFGDGLQTRDFIYVTDVVNANITAAESKETGIFNIAGGKQVSINEIVKNIMQITGKNLQPVYKKPRLGDIIHSYADISKAREKLKFEPQFSLKDGLKETINWFQP